MLGLNLLSLNAHLPEFEKIPRFPWIGISTNQFSADTYLYADLLDFGMGPFVRLRL